MPILGADMTSGTLTAWEKQPGDAVRRGDIIAVVETDKADVEVEVFVDGVIEKLLVAAGAEAPVGTPLAIIREAGEPAGAVRLSAAPPPPPTVPRPFAAGRPAPAMAGREPGAARPAISPAARKLAQTLGVNLAAVCGTGPAGRIQERDIQQAAAAITAPQPAEVARHAVSYLRASPSVRLFAASRGVDLAHVTATGPGGRILHEDVERSAAEARPEPLRAEPAPPATPLDRRARMRQAIAAAMQRSSREIPHFHLLNPIDMSAALNWLTAENTRRPVTRRLLYGALLLKAVALALRDVPELNATWENGQTALKQEINVGVAIALRGGGLVAPALHRTDQLRLTELMEVFRDLVQRARAGSLRSSELYGPTITVTSLGEQGVEGVFGLIYPPQVALVGFGKIVERPWSVGGAIVSRPVIVSTLAADHRVVDGHRGSAFLACIERLLQEPEKL